MRRLVAALFLVLTAVPALLFNAPGAVRHALAPRGSTYINSPHPTLVNTLRTGIGAPSNLLGNNGDFYIDATRGAQTLYGPKFQNVWPTPGVSMVGGGGALTAGYPYANLAGVPFPDWVNAKTAGAIGNGSTDDSAALLAAANAANAAGGGTIFFPAGTYITTTLPVYSKVHYVCASEESTILKLKGGTNSDLFQGSIQGYANGSNGYTGASSLVNIAAPASTGNSSGVNSFSIRHCTLDGNAFNQTAYGAGLRVYGYGYRLENLYIRNFFGDGIYQDWNPATKAFSLAPNQLEIQVHNVKVHDIGYGQTHSTGMGIRWAGGTDSQIDGVIIYKTGSHGMQIGPNAAATQITQLHIWGMQNNNNAAGLVDEAPGVMCMSCEVEGSDLTQVAQLASQVNWYGGKIFSGGAPGLSHGMQLGQLAGDTPYVGSVFQTTPGSLANPPTAGAGTLQSSVSNRIYAYFENTSAGAFYPRSENSNDIQALGNQTNATAMLLVDGTLSGTDNYITKSHGIASNHLNATVGGIQITSDASRILTLTDLAGHDIFNFNGSSRPYGAAISQYPATDLAGFSSWFYNSTFNSSSWNISHNGFIQSVTSGFAVGSNTSVATASIPSPWVLGNGATVTVYNSAAACSSCPNPQAAYPYGKVRLNATAAVTGLVMQACNVDGTEVTLIDESAYSMTFAASASNVAIPSFVLPANQARKLMCNLPASLWYPLSGS